MSLRSQPLPPAPGPPPLVPPPPLPNVSPPRHASSSPRPRPRASEVQWQSRPQSQETGDAVTWSTKPSLHTVSDTQLEGERPLPRNRRTSLSSLSLNRLSLSSKKEKPPPSPEPPVPPLKSSSQRKKPLEVRATVGNSRGVQRRTSGVERRVSVTRSSSLTPTSRNLATGTARSPSDTPPISPISPTLNKKRSFFRRVADRLTRSRTHLRDEAQANGTQPSSPEEPDSAPSHASDGVQLPGPLPSFSYSPCSTSLPPTPRSVRTRKAPPPSIKVPGSTLGPSTLLVNGEGQFLDPELRSPSRVPLPPSPAVSSIYATSPRTATTSSGFQSTSPLATPTTPTPQVAALPRVPRKASSASALSELSRHGTVLNPIDDRPPLPSPHGLNFPLPPITQPASRLQGRASSDGFTLKGKDIHSKTMMSVHPFADSQALPELAEVPNHATFRHAGSSKPNNHALPGVLRDENAMTKNSCSGSGDSHTRGSCGTWQSDSRPRSSSLSDQDKQLLSGSTRILPRIDAHARADSHTLGMLLLNLQQSPSRGDRASHGHARADSNTLPPPNSSTKLIQDKEESQPIEEEEVQLANLKVSRWLAESPIASAPSSPRQSVSFSISESSFGHATGSFSTWKTALEAAEMGDDHQLTLEVERLALEAEEQGGKEETEEPIRIEEKKSTRRSHNLFGRKQEKAEIVPIPSSPRSFKENKRRSLRFLTTRNITLPPSPALPSRSISSTSFVSPPQASDEP